MDREICTHCEKRPIMEGVGERCLECWQERFKPEEFQKENIIKDIRLALKGQLNDIMADSRPLDWKRLYERHKSIINYLEENLK